MISFMRLFKSVVWFFIENIFIFIIADINWVFLIFLKVFFWINIRCCLTHHPRTISTGRSNKPSNPLTRTSSVPPEGSSRVWIETKDSTKPRRTYSMLLNTKVPDHKASPWMLLAYSNVSIGCIHPRYGNGFFSP